MTTNEELLTFWKVFFSYDQNKIERVIVLIHERDYLIYVLSEDDYKTNDVNIRIVGLSMI